MSEIIDTTTDWYLSNRREGLTRGAQSRAGSIALVNTTTYNDKHPNDIITAGAEYRMSKVNITTPKPGSIFTPTETVAPDNKPEMIVNQPTRREIRSLDRAEYNSNHRIRHFRSKVLELLLKPLVK